MYVLYLRVRLRKTSEKLIDKYLKGVDYDVKFLHSGIERKDS